MSRAAVVDELRSNLVVPVIGHDNLAAYNTSFNDWQTDKAATISFKVRTFISVIFLSFMSITLFFANHYSIFNQIYLPFSIFISQNGCARGVTGTPDFFVNGIPLSDSGSPLDYNKCISIFHELVGKIWVISFLYSPSWCTILKDE
jgi:hypothetical protein